MEEDAVHNTILCPEAGCDRVLTARLVAQVDSAAVLLRTYAAQCPLHGEFRQPELIDRAVRISFPALRD
jgi:hypothetical protein